MKPTDILKPVTEKPVQIYMANDIQVADMVEWALEQAGEADVDITSFSISEEFLRRIFFIRRSYKVRRLRLMLDFKATNKTLALWPFIRQTIEQCYLANNHSKFILVCGDSVKIAIVTSQNMTRGNRYEAATVCANTELVEELRANFEYVKNFNSVPFNDLYRERVGDD